MVLSSLFSIRVMLLLLVFGLAVFVAYTVIGILSQKIVVRRRLDDVGSTSAGASVSLRSRSLDSQWARLIHVIESRGLSLADTNDVHSRKRLIAAGFTAPEAPRLFTLIRLVMTLALPLIFVLLSLQSADPPSILTLYLMGGALALLGLYLPNLFISARAGRRQEEVVHGFPDALDLILVCTEAGLGLEAALDRVGREITQSHPLVSAMLGQVTLEMRAGRSRADALRRMADDVAVDEIRSFATLLIQSDQLGSSIGQTLRVYAAEMREKRRMRAEEKAHRLPVLLSIPLVACMLPVMIGVLMLPAGIRVVRELLPAMAGG